MSKLSSEQKVISEFQLRYWVLGICFQLLTAFWAVAVIVRLLLQDRLPGLSAIYYATPPIVLSFMAIMLAIWHFCLHMKERASRWFIISAGCLIWMISTTVIVPAPLPENRNVAEKKIRAVFWNVGRGMSGWEKILTEAQKLNPDIMGFVETGFDTVSLRAQLQKYFPDHNVSILGGGFALISKGSVSQCTPGTLGDMGEYRELDVFIDGQSYRICLVDIQSHPFRDRRATLDSLASYAESNNGKNLIIMGDLNTPTDSLHLQKLRASCTNAFEVCGNGYIATWPVPFPVLILDQIWINPQLVPVQAKLGWNYASDHRPLVVEVLAPETKATHQLGLIELLPPE